MARIIVTNHNIDNNRIVVNFDTIKEDSFRLEMELKDSSTASKAIWSIFSNGEQLDSGDLTKGNKAELIVLKSYAGSHEKPHLFSISTKDENGNSIASIQLVVVAKPTITEAKWWNNNENREAYEVGINNNSTVYIKGIGLYGHPLKIDVYFKRNDGESKLLFTSIFAITELYSLQGFYLSYEEFLKNKSFYAALLPILIKSIVANNTLAFTGKVKHSSLGKMYFIISYDDLLLFDGDKRKKYLDVFFDPSELEKRTTTISPVTVYDEQYFTQKYEPCKYERVFYKYGSAAEVKLFDEKEPTRKGQNGQLNNMKFLVSTIAPPKNSKNIKELSIRLENVVTKECQYIDENTKQTFFSENDERERGKPHKGRVIDTQALEDSQIRVQVVKEDERINIYPSFNYQYDEKSSWDFLKNYFLFSSMMSNTDPAYSALKSVLMDWEINSKDLIQYYTIPIDTCRYQKNLYLKTFADVAWGFHALFDDPYIPEYYLFGEQETIKTVKGLSEELDWIKNSPIADRISATIISPVIGTAFIRNFVLDIIKDMADRYAFGFTAYYDFDKDGKKNSKQIDYADTHPGAFKALIAGVVTLEILIDVLLIILTEGAALANFISKAGKVAGVINKGTKVVNAGKKAGNILANYSEAFATARNVNMAKNTLEMMKGSYFRGYRFTDDPDIGVQPVMEERIKISPLLNMGVKQKKSLGELLLDKTPAGMTLNMAKAATGGFGLGVSRIFLTKIKGGKKAVSWYGAITYPLHVANTTIDGVYKLLAFATDTAVKEIFGAEAEFEKDITAHIDLDFWLKIHNAEKRLNIATLASGQSKTDHSSISIAPSGAFTLRLKLSGSITNKNVIVKAMHVLTWNNRDPNEEKDKEKEAKGEFQVTGNIFIERRYYFKADGKPYHEDKIAFTGLAGQYEYKVKRRTKRDEPEEDIVKQEPKQFMLIEPCQLVFNSTEMTKNPSE
ncbi:hypothetical protein HX126_11605 [Chryseobacterium indologenes]|uniref:hypothetical protein n=1 Tax=Chryseobacterium indologenes TaxID=253 RepID=UPI002578307F|nr:hypothetical protein [Chryseobacterium indologenes]MDM1555202.1 hypothetical protein [Chryseobacterium indologenes]